jgi:hypothetical protein
MLINMCVDVAAYPGFRLFALGVCIRAIVLDGMGLPCGWGLPTHRAVTYHQAR